MRIVCLRMNENYIYEIIKKLVETNGNKKNAAIKLNCTTRTINRLILQDKNYGKQGFIHGNRYRKPAITINCIYHIPISKTTIKRWLDEVHVLSPKATRVTKKG